MLINCPHCTKTLNINGALGTFTCPFCKQQSQINGSQVIPLGYGPQSTPLNQPILPSPSSAGNSSMYSNMLNVGNTPLNAPSYPTPGMRYGQQPCPIPSPYGGGGFGPCPLPSVDPIASAFQFASGGQNAISVNGLRSALQQLGIQLSVEICNQLFLKHDADRSGSIQLNEFRSIQQEVNQWVSVFNSLDTDHSGKMEYGEFVDAMHNLNFNIADNMLPVVFNNMDNLHNGYIDLNGFIKVVSIIQVLQMKMAMYDPQQKGTICVDLNGILDIVMALPL